MQKIKLGELIQQLVNEIDTVDASDLTQTEKSRRYKSAATRFKNALFGDKRKYRGKGMEKRITANTYNAYMTKARSKFDDRFHHDFEKNINRMAKKYPLYGEELREWLTLTPADVRQRHQELTRRLKEIMPLAEELSGVKYGTKPGERKLHRLAVKYPEWKFALFDAAGENWKEAQAHLHKLFQSGIRLLEDISKLRINHAVLYTLQLSAAERNSIRQRWNDVLSEKKRNTVLLDYPTYMGEIFKILEAPPARFNLDTRVGMAPLAFALAAVSGRRMIEIMFQGEFKAVGKNQVEFTGQAKKRVTDDATRTIYTLCDAALFMDRLTTLRNCPAASDFDVVAEGFSSLDNRSENGRINAILAGAFNPWVKKFFNDERRVYKDSRAIYARIAYERWFRHDPRWADKDEDVFFAEILGHDDENTQLHYKQFKLHNFSLTWHPAKGNENRRLAALQALDDEVQTLARSGAAERIHEATKQIIAENPDKVIKSQTLRELNFYRPLIKRYLEFIAPALGNAISEEGRLQLDTEPKRLILDIEEETEEPSDDLEGIDDDELEIEEAPHATPDADEEKTTPAHPRFEAPKRSANGDWMIRYEYAGQHYAWTGPAKNMPDAMRKAWDAYHDV